MDNFRKQHVIVVVFVRTKKIEEFMDQLLPYCEMASTLWHTIFSIVGLA